MERLSFLMRHTGVVIVILCFGFSMYLSLYVWPAGKNIMPKTINTPNASLTPRVNYTLILHMQQITVVTAFFDIGDFGKGSPSNIRTPETYFTWARTFRFLLNPLVVYTDSTKFFDHMMKLREELHNRTKVLMFNRTSSWAFQSKDIIKDIFNSKGYPKHYPNTVVPEYPCAMNAKYDVISKAATKNYFHTNFFMWLDVGLFRTEVKNEKYFMMDLPPDFNSSRVAVNQVYNTSMNKEISVIIKSKLDWICGCIFMGRRDIILMYTEQYKNAVDYLLTKNFMNSDQQVLYAIYSNAGRVLFKPKIDLQLYKNRSNPWFYLGYLMRKIVDSKNSTTV